MPVAVDAVYEHNIGDFFISEGIISSISFPKETTDFFVCKSSAIGREMVKVADVCILPGSPSWLFAKEVVVKYCIEFNKRVLIFGAGSYNPDPEDLIQQLADKDLLRVYSVRDSYAGSQLSKYGAVIRPCPSVHYFDSVYPNSRNVGLAFKYSYLDKSLRVLGTDSLRFLFDKLRERLFNPIVICHAMEDYAFACSVFGKVDNIFYSRHYTDYKKVYESLSMCIGNRLHAVLPSLSVGMPVFSLSLDARYDALDTISSLLEDKEGYFCNNRMDKTNDSDFDIVEKILNWVSKIDFSSVSYKKYFDSIVCLKKEDRKYLSSLEILT